MREGQNKPSINNGMENKNSRNPEKEIEQSTRLNFDDLMFIVNESLGLRHVSSEETAKQEMIHGTKGDALAISGALKLLSEQNLKRLAESTPAFATAQKFKIKIDILLQDYPELIDEQAREQIVKTFNEQIKEFMTTSFGLDINEIYDENEGATVSSIISAILEKAPSFIIVTIPRKGGYDDKAYHGLGKSGSGSIESFTKYIKLDKQDFSDWRPPTDELNRETFNLLCDFMAQKMLDKLSLSIKEMKNE